jgi:flagellar biosynthesis/type III secretory pathway protein FliH
MAALTLPSGAVVNPLFIRSAKKNAHFWGSRFYVSLQMRGEPDIDVEGLLAAEANAFLRVVQGAIDDALAASDAYDNAHDAGYSAGYHAGHLKGYDAGYEAAKDAFWSYAREEYRINEHALGYEAGKRDGLTEGDSAGWQRGYTDGMEEGRSERPNSNGPNG